ncbi:MAG TPA: hypothetical protein PLI16_03120 [Bacteroidales bacterium]|mgnify:FL=1|jgi:hypothetical protein|nr:hypothetical protein [Bacteroidales bacterium]HNZ42625.1 hypothetical protein [Bacteroidales bacterium]HOH83576.1 hypothetical protein [Bacteroidales bacterium]HPB26227.1 hypothetical protein [Bacteroidales bacterium]HPI30823.1 hypothetical protein [Bacteroidales bacterium]
MEDFLDILKYTIPSGVVFATAFFILRAFLQNGTQKKLLELKLSNQNVITPVRLQAYERVILLLERISPSSLVLRVARPGMSAVELQAALLQTVRDEFEHNLSQQIYMSGTAWDMTRNAKEEMIKIINLASTRLNDEATAADLGSVILELAMSQDKLPVNMAIDYIKKEARQLY